MKRLFIVFLILIPIFIFSQPSKNIPNLKLIPSPKNLQVNQDQFIVSPKMTISFDKTSSEDNFSADALIKEIKTSLGYSFKKESSEKKGNIILVRQDLNTLPENIRNAPEFSKIGDEGYFLQINPEKIMIFGNTSKGIFYGIQTLKQLIRTKKNKLPCLLIADWPSIQYRGWQDDISRGPIPTLDYLKKEIEVLSAYKLNTFTLYTEHVFRLNKHPKIAPSDGITKEEIKELSEFANKYHVELIGNFQSFGHFANILKIPEYSSLGESNWVISPAKEESYNFLADVFSEIAPAYESKLFNINCDETDGLGSGASKRLVDSIGLEGVYAYHINRLDKLLKPYGKTMMMWGDIAVHNKGIIQKLPKDLIVLSWGYDANESFDSVIVPFTETGFKFMVCPGVNCWSRIFPDFETATINISNYIRDGAKFNTLGVINTTWDDDNENLFEYNYYPLMWGAECSWTPVEIETVKNNNSNFNKRLEMFDSSIDGLFFAFDKAKIFKEYSRMSSLKRLKCSGTLFDGKFWGSLSLASATGNDTGIKKELDTLLSESQDIIKKLSALKKSAKDHSSNIDFAVFAAGRIKFISKRDLLQHDINQYLLKQGSPKELKAIHKGLNNLISELTVLKKEYSRLWRIENREWWLDKVDARYEKLLADLKEKELEVIIEPDKTIIDGKLKIELKTFFGNEEIRYTMDGTEPLISSEKYNRPFLINSPTIIKAAVFKNGKTGKITVKNIKMNLSFWKDIKFNSEFSYKYPGGGLKSLTDGETGSMDHRDGFWQGYEGNNVDVVVDLGSINPVKKISMNFLEKIGSWIFPPVQIECFASVDGKDYKNIYTLDLPEIDPKAAPKILNTTIELKDVTARYIQVIVKNIGKCPKWHAGADGKAWIFIDEIDIE